MKASFIHEITKEVRDRINDLFTSLGIPDSTGQVAQSLVGKLKASDNMSLALQYIFQKLPPDTDDETLAALRKHIRKTLREIVRQIETEGGESVSLQK